MDSVDLVAERKVKRFFRARRKLTRASVVSHITQRAAGKDPCFVEDDDFLRMLGFMKESVGKHAYRLYAFCLMRNHVHLLLQPTEGNLQDAMRDLFSRYAAYFNRKYERRGHLFGGPYRQAVCLDDAYLLAASLYIHLNPVNAGIVTVPAAYRWSSVRLFVEKDETLSFVEAGFVLRLLDDERVRALTKYDRMLQRGTRVPISYTGDSEDEVERFKETLARIFPKIFGRMVRDGPVARMAVGEVMSLEHIEKRIDETLAQYKRSRPGSRPAMRFVIQQLVARGFKRREIAARLGVSRKTVYNLLNT